MIAMIFMNIIQSNLSFYTILLINFSLSRRISRNQSRDHHYNNYNDNNEVMDEENDYILNEIFGKQHSHNEFENSFDHE